MILKDKNLYYVGGVVRDEILGEKSIDTDLCYEGNAIEYAKSLGLNILQENPDFGTVCVSIDGEKIDIASTRKEIYPQKGHLPKILEIGCPLKEDMKRRDFTINAIAKRTTDGKMFDFFDGLKDIKSKKLRVLHQNSFIDDPTRIIRGLKFSVRFGYELEDGTKKLQEDYLSNINYDMSYHRLKNELKDTFNLNKAEAFDRFVSMNLYKLLGKENKNICFKHITGKKIEELININPNSHIWLIYLSFFNLADFELTRTEKRILEWVKRLETEEISNNTPKESILIKQLRDKDS